jgi:RHS repeat-associated protein
MIGFTGANNGEVIAFGTAGQRRYTAYGATLSETGTTPTSRRYTGQVEDNTGLTLMGARYYDPYLNRWIQPDTRVPEPNDPQALDRYMYGRNNSLKYTDPTGHFSEDAIVDYLKARYGEQWNEVLDTWKGNGDLWASFSEARP